MSTPATQDGMKLEASTPSNAQDASAVQQQQPAATQQQPPTPATAQPSVGGDQLVCQWTNCGERCVSAEQLYDHVCERHVGRKSTNNLNLTCQWGNCRTTTVKRDHITSHIRVHVPLKPHKCDFCGKAFKRPQDLKKHVKTHADDSVLLRSPEPRNQHGGPGGYQPGPGKLVADLQALAATASGYYPDGGLNQNSGHPYPNPGANAAAAFYSSAPPNSAYGPVYYQVNQPTNLSADYEIRKRAAYDALNEFFGEAKRRLIDPSTYYDVGARLAGITSFGPPAVGGFQDYGSAGTMVASAAQPPHHQYSLPLPALRTKSDLLGVDQFLDQLQTTVYESSNHLAAAGVAQAGAHYIHPQVNYRSSNSPPSHGSASGQPATSHAQNAGTIAQTAAAETPALTPASSVLSYTAGQSPSSVNSASTVSPTSRTNMPSMYPTLPSVSAMSEGSSAYPTTSGAPATGLGPSFSGPSHRRYSGGQLQKAAPDRLSSADAMDTSSDLGSPKESRRSSATGSPNIHGLHIQSPGSALDPSLRSPSSHSHSSADETESQRWLENMRTIEMLRSYIKDRLEHHDYESDGEGHGESGAGPSKHEQTDEQSLYPVLRAVRDGSA